MATSSAAAPFISPEVRAKRTASYRPSVHRRWLWAHVEETPLVRLDDAARALLGKGGDVLAFHVAMACGGAERDWARLDYWKLSRLSGLTRRQVSRRVHRLARAGQIELAVRRCARGPEDLPTAPSHTTSVWCRPLGSFFSGARGGDVRPENVHLMVAREGWDRFAALRQTHGGRRAGAGRKRRSPATSTPPAGAEIGPISVNQDGDCPPTYQAAKCLIPGREADERVNQVGRLQISDSESLTSGSAVFIFDKNEAPTPADRQSALPPGGSSDLRKAQREVRMTRVDSAPAPTSTESSPTQKQRRGAALEDLFDSLLTGTPIDKATPSGPTKTPPPAIPIRDPIPGVGGVRLSIPETAPDAAKVSILVSAYNEAARVRDPKAPPLFAGADVRRSRHYPRLLQAANVLVEHEISPYEWADWRMAHADKTGQPRPSLTRVFTASTIEKLRGLHRREYDHDIPTSRPERMHMEQRHREDEAMARWRMGGDDGDPDSMPPITAPAWYVEMRRAERRSGELDPLALWPSKLPPRRAR